MEQAPPVPHLIELPEFRDPRGSLSFVEEERHIPFSIARSCWMYGAAAGEGSGEQGACAADRLLVALSGCVCVRWETDADAGTCSLSRPCCGLHLPRGCRYEWRDIAGHSVVLVLSSAAEDGKEEP